MDIYRPGEVEFHYAPNQQVKEFKAITKADVIDQQFIYETGIHGEPAVDLINVNAAILTITIPQMSDEILGFEAAYKIQMTGVLGILTMLKTAKKNFIFPVCFLKGRPVEVFDETATYLKYTIVSTDQWSVPNVIPNLTDIRL